MSMTDRAEITNWELSQSMGSHVTVGSSFAFVKGDLFKTSAFSWLQNLIGKQASNKINIIHLFKPEGIEIAGVKISPTKIDRLELCSITSDKSLYKADSDTVDLFLLNPVKANQNVIATVLCNGALYAHRNVDLGTHGQGKLTLQDLPAGEYEVLFEGSTNNSRYCKFTVAQYKLVPLVAELKERSLGANSQLEMTVKLSTFGVPVNSGLSISLFDRGNLISSISTNAVDGIAQFALQLVGQGPHSVNFQLTNDPGKTASIPIVGSRETERSQTLFNPLGTELFGSLLPTEGANEVRGIYLTQGGLSSSPLRLELDENQVPRLTTTTEISALTVVRIDPTFSQARQAALNPQHAQHPSHQDQDYNAAIKFFERQMYEDALRLFNSARAKQVNPHPYYAYYAGCCHAKLGRIDHALEQLKLSIIDGWLDFSHMQTDEDLSALHADERFEDIASGGFREYKFENLPANHLIEIPATKALTLLALGAVVNDQPWEGWTSYISPSQVSASIEAESEFKSGQSGSLKIKVSSKGKDSAVYIVVKDARLLSQDMPHARMAAALKEYVQSASKELKMDYPKLTLASLCQQTPRKNMMFARLSAPANDSWGAAPAGAAASGALSNEGWGSANAMQESAWRQAEDFAFQELSSSPASPPPPGSRSAPTLPQPSQQPAPPSSQPQERSMEVRKKSFKMAVGGSSGGYGSSLTDQITAALGKSKAANQLAKAGEQAAPVMQKGHEPEVIFSDFVELKDSEAVVEIPLPSIETDYVVECFVVSDWDWCCTEARFRAVSDPLAEFTLPRFVSEGEYASSYLHVGSRSGEFKCVLTHNGKEMQLRQDSNPVSPEQLFKQMLVNLQFSAGPGVYRAVVSDGKGKTLSQIEQTVDEPGKLRRLVRSMRMLNKGESIDLKGNSSIVALRVLPGLKDSFQILMDATADYGHACCEQTAAKIMAGCAMYVFSGDDPKRQEKAESIIIAGIKREESMWLRSRGFKSYPERPDVPDTHYGMAAAQHLSNLALLDANHASMSKDLRAAIKLGTQMSSDALAAYGIVFPPKAINSMKDAYLACRFSNNGITEEALKFIRSKTSNVDSYLKSIPYHPNWGYAVNTRVESAYAAAALMRQKNGSDLSTSLALANHVIKGFNQEGRLYSTLDSVAAISLFVEMTEAKLVSGAGAGNVEVNGILMNLDQALKFTECIDSVKCVEGVVAVEVESEVLEDWSVFDGKLGLRVALEKNGQAQRTFKLGDQINLKVRLEQGYKDGDLLWLCLPDSLSRVYGGAQVKLFSIDFKGETEVSIPIAVTGTSEGPDGKKGQQRLALCVRNMYEEERGGNPGLIPITIS